MCTVKSQWSTLAPQPSHHNPRTTNPAPQTAPQSGHINKNNKLFNISDLTDFYDTHPAGATRG